MKPNFWILIFVSGLLLYFQSAAAQRAGQSVSVRVGTVSGMRSVDLNDGSAVGGALVGGAFGAALTRSSKSSSTRNRNAAIGAVLGGAASGSSKRPGRIYSVTTNEGTTVQIVTEQTEIRVDDCVYVEESRGVANIRRAPQAACESASQSVLESPTVASELREDAAECASAKQEVVDADSNEALDRAVRKVQILCYD